MLESQRFLIAEQGTLPKSVVSYDIFDADTQERIGSAGEESGTGGNFFRWLISRGPVPATIEVRETADESLVFTIGSALGFWRPRVDVYDADHNIVGYFKRKLFSWADGFWIYDRLDDFFAEVQADKVAREFVFVTTGGHRLGAVTNAQTGKELQRSSNAYLLALHDELTEEPIAKMLLLAAALMIDILHSEASR
jgi:hypothetical protein